MTSKETIPSDYCPGTGKRGKLEFQTLGGDEWYVKCPVCGMTWMGGSAQSIEPHKDWRHR
jgi:hypothetical protein